MADTFSGITSRPVMVLLADGTVATWTEYSATAQPSGVVFRFRLPPEQSAPSTVAGQADALAGAFNSRAQLAGVRSIATYQDIDAQNQIEDRLTVTVTSDSGQSTASVDVAQADLSSAAFADAVNAARAQLNAVEAL